jgi:hypothetical protein
LPKIRTEGKQRTVYDAKTIEFGRRRTEEEGNKKTTELSHIVQRKVELVELVESHHRKEDELHLKTKSVSSSTLFPLDYKSTFK